MRNKTELLGLHNTSPITNHAKAIKDSLTKPPPAYTMDGLISEQKWKWIKKTISSIWSRRVKPYPTYTNPAENNGIFKMKLPANGQVSIAVLSDWASDTPESQLIASQVGIRDYSIHLGDTYYVGNAEEIRENFNTDENGTWPYGSHGSFALPGNHEMYSGGRSFFKELLPFMGSYNGQVEKPVQMQQAGFFCLENDCWRVIGLDTGYDSLTGFFGLTPNLKLDLQPALKDWLRNTVSINDDKRGIIILSHHQVYSAFEQEFPNPANFISELMAPSRPVIWLMGHEHRLAIYGANTLPNGGKVFSRCIGNGGMPVELNDVDGRLIRPKDPADKHNPVNRNLVLHDQRQREIVDENIPLGHNGYVILTLDNLNLTITYFDDNDGSEEGRKILEEKWSLNLVTGELTGQSIINFTDNLATSPEKQLSLFSAELTDAIT